MPDKDVTTGKYYRERFEKISKEKRDRILGAAITEFAANGFSAASINTIARQASISIGSMYSYFESKECLFLTILDDGYQLLEQALSEVVEQEGDVFDKMRRMLTVSVLYARRYHKINQIYIDLSTEGLSHMASETSLKMESITASFYRRFLTQALEEGKIRPDLDPGVIAFCIDNIVMLTQFSFASAYYHERMKIYAGESIAEREEMMIKQIVDFIKHGIAAD